MHAALPFAAALQLHRLPPNLFGRSQSEGPVEETRQERKKKKEERGV